MRSLSTPFPKKKSKARSLDFALPIFGSTDEFSAAILTHLFRPYFALDPPHSYCYASGLPPCLDKKIYANLADFILSVIPFLFIRR